MSIVTAGIDLAKKVFALHGVEQIGKAVFSNPYRHRHRHACSLLNSSDSVNAVEFPNYFRDEYLVPVEIQSPWR